MSEIRPDDREQLSPQSATAMGVVFILVGLIVIMMGSGIIPTEPSTVNAPPWVITSAGAVFALCGAAVINGYVLKKDTPSSNTIQNLLGAGIVILMLTICGWVAFGPGERHFTASSSFSAAAPTDEKSGRIAFGIGFVVLFVMFAIGIVAQLKKKIK